MEIEKITMLYDRKNTNEDLNFADNFDSLNSTFKVKNLIKNINSYFFFLN